MITQILLAVVVILLGMLIFLAVKGRGVKPRDIENAVSTTWTKLGLGEKIGKELRITERDKGIK